MSQTNRFQEDAEIIENLNYRGDYYCITFSTPTISPHVQPGQFVHLRLPDAPELLLRRPFSIYDTDVTAGTLSLIYKTVGKGTSDLALLTPGITVNLLGPLGNGFPAARENEKIVI